MPSLDKETFDQWRAVFEAVRNNETVIETALRVYEGDMVKTAQMCREDIELADSDKAVRAKMDAPGSLIGYMGYHHMAQMCEQVSERAYKARRALMKALDNEWDDGDEEDEEA